MTEQESTIFNSTDQFAEYTKKWESGTFDKPLLILIGGHIGVGKSTFAETLNRRLTHATVTPTGVIRSILQTLTSEEQNPELFLHTYDLSSLYRNSPLTEEDKAVRGYEAQAQTVDKGVRSLVSFFESEGQMSILEGNHILPSTAKELSQHANIIPVFFANSDPILYEQTISGPTHRRRLSKNQLYTTRVIHDYITTQAINLGLPVFDIKNQHDALNYVSQKLKVMNEGIK